MCLFFHPHATATASAFLLSLLGLQELALEGGSTITVLTLRVIMARLSVRIVTSTDLTPEHTYIDPYLPYIDPYTTSIFIPCLVPCVLVGSYYNKP